MVWKLAAKTLLVFVYRTAVNEVNINNRRNPSR